MATKEVMSVFTHNPMLGHMTTFGGNPLSCAASLAAIEALENEHLMATVGEKEQLFKSLLKHDKIKEVRGLGLMIAVQLDSFDHVLAVIQKAFNQQLLLDWFLFNETAIRIAPPLSITHAEIARICEVIKAAL